MQDLRIDDPPKIGPYTLHGIIGSGGMGTVYLGFDGRKYVAIKVMSKHIAPDPEFRARFRREISAAQKVIGHNTVKVLGSGTDDSVMWFASDYVAGPNLAQVVQRECLRGSSLIDCARSLLGAIRSIHEAGIVHRDVKPENVILGLDGLKVVDFGVAHLEDQPALTRTGGVLGTVGFMPLEQLVGSKPNPSWDIFALGAVVAFAATGRKVCADIKSVLDGPDLTGVPSEMLPLVEACLHKDAAQRPGLAEIEKLLPEATSDTVTGTGWLPLAIARQVHEVAEKEQRERPEPATLTEPPPTPASTLTEPAIQPVATTVTAATTTAAKTHVEPLAKPPVQQTPKRREWLWWAVYSVIVAIAVAVFVESRKNGDDDPTPQPSPSATASSSASASANPSFAPNGLPNPRFSPQALGGSAYITGTSPRITVTKAETASYGMTLTVEATSYTAQKGKYPFQETCLRINRPGLAPYVDIHATGYKEAAGSTTTVMKGKISFDRALYYPGHLKFVSACSAVYGVESTGIGENAVAVRGIASDSSAVIPVLKAEQSGSTLKLFVPSYDGLKASDFCLKLPSGLLATPIESRDGLGTKAEPHETVTFNATSGTFYLSCKISAAGAAGVVYNGEGVTIS